MLTDRCRPQSKNRRQHRRCNDRHSELSSEPRPLKLRQNLTRFRLAESAAQPTRTPNRVQKGFTLRFESDQALTRLVARDVVGLYAITLGQTRRLNIESGTMSFWPASTPEKIHEMDAATVPEPVLSAYRRNVVAAATETKWGVSIPAAMSQQLGRFPVREFWRIPDDRPRRHFTAGAMK